MMDDIQMMAMSFNYYEEVNLKTARELTIYVINEYLSAINSNKELRPYLHEYPFTAKNVEIRIFIYVQAVEITPFIRIADFYLNFHKFFKSFDFRSGTHPCKILNSLPESFFKI